MRPAHFAELQAFVAIVEERSFRRAGTRLGLTTSTLSHALRALEERLGVQLVARTTRTVAPTPAGAALLAELAPAFGAMDAAVEGLGGFRVAPHGRLRLSVPRSAATQVLAPRFAAFAEAFPDVTLEVVVDDRFVDIVRDGFDAGIRLGESVERDMTAVRVSPDGRAAVVGSPAYFARHPPPAVPRDLAAHRCINRRLTGSGAMYRWQFAKGADRVEVAVAGPLTLEADDLMLRAALDGVGLACLSEADVLADLASGRLVRALEDWCPPVYGFFLYHPRSRQVPANLQALIDVLTDRGP